MKNILVVVDMQNDFLNKDGALYIGHDTSALKKKIGEFIRDFDGTPIFTADVHKKDDVEFGVFPEHCVEGSGGEEFVEEMVDDAWNERRKVVTKKSYTDVLVANEIIEAIVGEKEHEIHVVGVCTHICVHDVIADLVNWAKNSMNTIPNVILHTDMIDDFDSEMAAFAIKRLKTLYGVKLV